MVGNEVVLKKKKKKKVPNEWLIVFICASSTSCTAFYLKVKIHEGSPPFSVVFCLPVSSSSLGDYKAIKLYKLQEYSAGHYHLLLVHSVLSCMMHWQLACHHDRGGSEGSQ